MLKPLNIAMIGAGFMGRAHSQAWLSVNRFFDLPLQARLWTVCGRDAQRTRDFAGTWGWANAATSLREVLADSHVDLIDIVTPNHLHAQQALAVLRSGRHVACEKPLAATLRDAERMARAAARGRQRRTPCTFVWFNYRRCPAIAMAHELVRANRLGRIFHVRACYLQDWGGPRTPLTWRFQSQRAGSGAHGDLNAHLVDMARFICGDEIVEVAGAITETFVTRRSPAPPPRGARAAASPPGRAEESTVDDCALFLARFRSGAVGSFEATRLATGNLNRNSIEVNGERGSIRFDFERMNELLWWDHTLPVAMRGWTTINCTQAVHPYAGAYWPPGHGLGYEHTFISQAADIIMSIAGRKPRVPLADFADALQTQRVLDAGLVSARRGRAVKVAATKTPVRKARA